MLEFARRVLLVRDAFLSVGILGFAHESHAQGYTLELMAVTDPTLTAIDPETSMNDEGVVAFTGRDASGLSLLYVVTAPGMAAMPISFGSANRNFRGAAINNESPAQVASRDQVTGGTPAWLVRKWPADGSQAFTTIGRSTTFMGMQPNFDSASLFVDINDGGVVALAALISGSTLGAVFAGTAAPPVRVACFVPWQTPLRPQIANDNRVVVRDDLGRVVVYAYPNSAASCPGGVPELITGPPFTGVGEKPGISPDGVVVAWIGTPGAGMGEGVYVSVPYGASRQTVRIADGSDGFTDVSEFQRAAVVTNGRAGDSPLMTVAFVGTRGGVTGLYAVHAHAETLRATFSSRVGAARAVARVGDVVGGKTIASLTSYDPFNRCGHLVCYATFTDGTAGILRARPGMPARRKVRVSAKKVLGPGGTPASFWACNIEAVVARASSLLKANANIELTLEEVVDLPDPGGLFVLNTASLPAIETAAIANPTVYAWRSDAINIYFNSSTGVGGLGICSFPLPTNPCAGPPSNHEIIVIAPMACMGAPTVTDLGETVAHEVGHYFNLLHTHEGCTGAEATPPWPASATHAPNGCVAGDLCADTPTDDPNQNLGNLATWYGMGSANYTTVTTNLMSYYCGLSTLTRDQVARMDQAAELFRQQVVIAPAGATTQMVGPGCGGVGGAALFVSPPRFNTVGVFRITGATPNAPGQFFFSLPPITAIPLGGCCGVYVDIVFGTLNPLLPVLTDASGNWTASFYYPPIPALTGLSFALQGVVYGGSGIPGLDLSGGAVITLGN